MKAALSRNTIILTISNIGGAALSFLLIVLIGRALGERSLGVYAVALAWVYPLNLLVEFGMGTLMMRDLAARPATTPDYLRLVVALRLIMGGAVTAALLAAAPLISHDPAIVAGLHVSAPMVIILPLYSTFTAVFRAREAMLPVMWLNLGMLAAQVALTWALLSAGGDVVGALVINTVTSAGQLVAAWAWYRVRYVPRIERSAALAMEASGLSSPEVKTPGFRKAKPTKGAERPSCGISPFSGLGRWQTSFARQHGGFNLWRWLANEQVVLLLRRAAPFALAGIFAALQGRLTLILLESYTAEAGYFTAANRFVEAARLLPNAFFGALFPALAGLALDRARMAATFARAQRALAAFGLVSAAALIVLGGWLLPVVFGQTFAPAAPVLQMLALSLLPFGLRGARTIYWYAIGGERYVNWVNGAVLALQLGLGLWLIPRYGAGGAALSVALVESAALALLWRRVRQ